VCVPAAQGAGDLCRQEGPETVGEKAQAEPLLRKAISEGSSIMRTTVTFEGNLADDPQTRFTGSGRQVTELTVLVNQRRQNGEGEWVDGEPTRHVVRAFKTLAENIAASLAKGDRVFVHGTVTTEAWTDRQSGERRTAQRVLAEVVGPSLRWATARITKTTRSSAGEENPPDIGEQES
jgi:single-strand DNA-binding protein